MIASNNLKCCLKDCGEDFFMLVYGMPFCEKHYEVAYMKIE